MKKIDYNLYMYKGIEVKYDLIKDLYVAEIHVNDWKLPLTIMGTTQFAFKRIFNDTVKTYGGLK